MAGKVSIVCIIILIIFLFLYLFKTGRGTDRNEGKDGEDSGNNGGKKVPGPKFPPFQPQEPVEIADAPVLYVRRILENGEDYRLDPYTMKYPKYTIGRDSGCDLVLDEDPKVEKVHAVIEKHVSGNNVFYLFKSQAKINPTDFKYKAEDNYKRLGRGDSVELGRDNFIYVGDTQIIITLPDMGHVHTNTTYINRTGTAQTDESEKLGGFLESERVISRKDKEIEQSIYLSREIDL